jgi:hypothetical protein
LGNLRFLQFYCPLVSECFKGSNGIYKVNIVNYFWYLVVHLLWDVVVVHVHVLFVVVVYVHVLFVVVVQVHVLFVVVVRKEK